MGRRQLYLNAFRVSRKSYIHTLLVIIHLRNLTNGETTWSVLIKLNLIAVASPLNTRIVLSTHIQRAQTPFYNFSYQFIWIQTVTNSPSICFNYAQVGLCFSASFVFWFPSLIRVHPVFFVLFLVLNIDTHVWSQRVLQALGASF